MKLSIITINFNNCEGLRKTMESIIAQTFTNYEWVVIDGGSTDGSRELIEQYSNHITYWVSEPDKGIYNAMNKGIRAAKGEYLQFINSGDWLNNNEVLSEVFRELPQGDILYGNIDFYKDGNLIEERKYPDQLSFNYLLEYSLGHNATFIKRILFDEYPYNENLRIVSDWEFFLKQALNNTSFCHIDKTISCFDMSGISSSQQELVEKERYQVIDRIIPSSIQLDCSNLSHYESQFDNTLKEIQSYRSKKIFYRKMISFNLYIMKFLSKIIH